MNVNVNVNVDANAARAPIRADRGGWLQPLPSWPLGLLAQLRSHERVVRVLVARVRGSAPREAGASMLVTRDDLAGTIGGGHLEWQALQAARGLLAGGPAAKLQPLVLGTALGQCCGGVVDLWLERWTRADAPLLQRIAAAEDAEDAEAPSQLVTQLAVARGLVRSLAPALPAAGRVRIERDGDTLTLRERLGSDAPPVWLFGAGHVGQALAKLLADLPFRCTWLDARPDIFPAGVPHNLRLRRVPALDALADVPADGRFVVMTHDHALDYALVRALLARGDARFVGLIGSDSKAARFRSRLARDGIAAERIEALACPIGVPGVGSKWPAAIAVAVAAQLLQTLPAPEKPARRPAVAACAFPDCRTGCGPRP